MNRMEPEISIIIPVYNTEKYLARCLDSIVFSPGVRKTEVLVIDDGSQDSSGMIADSYAGKYPFIKVIHQQNAGVAAARNRGIDMARGVWLYFADPDDYLADGAVYRLLERCAKEEGTGSDIILFDAWKDDGYREYGWVHFGKEGVWRSPSKIRELQRRVLYSPGTGMTAGISLAAPWDKVYRKEFLVRKRIRFAPKLKVLDDMVFNMEAFGQAERVSYHKDRIYHYRVVSDSITNSYRPDRVEQDKAVWRHIQGYMEKVFSQHVCGGWGKDEKGRFLQAYYCRVIKSFGICCRLCFFNPQNKKRLWDKIGYVRETMEMEPYREAFRNVKLKNAEWKLKALIGMGRCRCGTGVYLLHLAQTVFTAILTRIRQKRFICGKH